jgi:hypothetical protein
LHPFAYTGDMSKHGWEQGKIKMSVKEFGSFRRDMVAFHNSLQVRFFEKAQRIYSRLKVAGKGKRGYDFHTAFDLAMVGASDNALSMNDAMIYNRTMSAGEAHDMEGYEEVKDALFPYEHTEHFTGRSRKPKAPKKSAFKMLKRNSDGIPVGDEAGISFDSKTRTVIWSVAENNHSVDRAHHHPTGREFFKRLDRVVWTRGTGGEIVGNDEYNRDARGSGEASNYVTNRYGVAMKEFKQSISAMRSWRS